MIVVVVACWALPAGAVTVGIARQAHPSTLTSQVLLRLSAEINSLGLEPRMVDLPDGVAGGALESLPALAAQNDVDAVIALRGAPLPAAVEVWAADHKGRSVARTVSMDPAVDRAPETIAIRAIELLRSCLLEIDLLAVPSPSAKPAAPAVAPPLVVERRGESPAPAPPPPSSRFGLAAGGVVVVDTGGVGPAVLPYLRFDWRFLAAWLARVEVAGAGTSGSVDGAAGSARVAQNQVLLGVAYHAFPQHRVRPLIGLAVGVLHTAAEGDALPQYDGQRVTEWSFLMSGVAGASVTLGPRWELTGGVHVQAAAPYPVVRFLGQTVATAAHPSLLFGLALERWL